MRITIRRTACSLFARNYRSPTRSAPGQGFLRLKNLLGRSRMTEATVVLPNDHYFPDPYDRSAESVRKLFNRMCDFMQVNPETITLDLFPDVADELREIVPVWHGGQSKRCAAGLYHHSDDSGGHRRAESHSSSRYLRILSC